MSYKCQICSAHVPAGVAQRRYAVMRIARAAVSQTPRTEVAYEYAVCEGCERELKYGTTIEELRHRLAPPVQLYVPPPEPPAETGKPVRVGRPIPKRSLSNGS